MIDNSKLIFKHTLFWLITALILQSCATSNCPNCSETKRTSDAKPAEWNIELKSSVIDECTGTETMSVLTDIDPTFLPNYNPEDRKCGDMPSWDGMKWEDYINSKSYADMKGVVRVIGLPCKNGISQIYSIPVSNISRITSTSNPMLMPPTEFKLKEPCICCDRIRDGLWFFDKFEIRAFAGFRNINDSIIYPSANGPISYKSSFYNSDRGGSILVPGAEVAGLWSVKFIDPKERFQAGVHSGLWLVDEAEFVPIGLHLRYTFNQKPNPYENSCNTPYVFGNVGVPLDFKTKAPLFDKRYYYSIGAGYDWAVSCGMDFSIDIGLRQMSLPLPPVDCCPNIPPDQRYFYRFSTLAFLRFGLTF
jgi:hypothetical protein